MKLALLEQDLPHYRVSIFKELEKYLKSKLTVFHGGQLTGDDHIILNSDKIPFCEERIQLKEILGGKLYFYNFSIFKRVLENDVVIIRGSIRNLTLIPLIKFLKYKKIPVILWGQGYSRKRKFRPNKNLFDKIYLYLIKIADAYICYTNEIKATLSKYIVEDKLFVANNTIDSIKILDYRNKLEKIGKKNIKKELRLNKQFYICFIGRLKKRKEIGYLLDVYNDLKKEKKDVGLIIIGDGDEKEKSLKKINEENIQDVRCTGKLIGYDAAKFMFASDVLVIPGWLGLAVNHGLLMGLPVVSQKKDDNLIGHPPEAKHIINGYNGFFSEFGYIEAMVDDVVKIFEDKNRFSANAIEYAENNLTLDEMLIGFKDAIDFTTKTIY